MGAAVAVSLGAGSVLVASAAVTSGVRSVFVPITPCRLFDSRPGDINVGPRATPLGAGEIARFPARGIAGRCTIPADAVGLQLNVTVLNGTAASYLTVWAAGDTQPLASSLNWMSGQAPTPNAVTSAVSASGEISLFNQSGSVDVLADVVGYYADHNFDDRYYTREQVDAILLAAGALMVMGGLTVLGIASVVEGGVRLGLAISLRRGARRVRIAVLVICGISAVLGWTVGGLGIIGAVINLVIVRCLVHDEAKEFFNA